MTQDESNTLAASRQGSSQHRWPYFKAYPDVFLIATCRMSLPARGAFFTLVMAQWREVDCRLPATEATLARAALCTLDEWWQVKAEVLAAFETDGTWVWYAPLKTLWQEAQASIEQRRAAGRASAKVRAELNERSTPVNDRSTTANELEKRREEESRREEVKDVCAVASTAPPAIASLPLIEKGKSFPITEAHLKEWRELYPAVDVMQELRNMRGWLEANPKNRKTAAGILRFINGWLAKEQNRAPREGGAYGSNRAHQRQNDNLAAAAAAKRALGLAN